jgi:hypothetical protein
MVSERQDQPQAPLSDRGYIGLSFSGGGYRATAFSLGTMALLQDLGLLGRARVMSSVSGGSLALAAYLCAKAGANLRQEADFHFYDRLWKPLMAALATEDLARAFVRLPLLLDGDKLILQAADGTQHFLNSLLGQEAHLGNKAITQMLRNRSLSPDYVFFNAANITSLDLFRFGIQRGGDAEHADPVYVLNRYFLTASGGSQEASDLYGHARQLRLGDCVAASFAFPGGFEPLIFPDDYFRSDGSPEDDEATAEALAQFRHSLICDRRAYVAFLDGGLYDNLGLASVEDIRRFLARRREDLERRQRFHPGRGEPQEHEQPIHYVIATDVDNIQPGLGFYSEPSLNPQQQIEQPIPKPSPRRGLGAIDLRHELGLSADFEQQSGAIDLRGSVRRLVGDLLRNLGHWLVRSPKRSAGPGNLWRATRERRLGQLLPAFNGYLKRTRSLTYGYLQKSYEPPQEYTSEAQRCHLIRNMIFELQPGPDVDPADAAELITLPVRDYRRRESYEPMQPIIRKLRHAAYAQDLLLALEQPTATGLALELLQPRQASQRDADLERSRHDLNLSQAARLWRWLTKSLEMEAQLPLDHGPLEDHPNRTLRQLVVDVRQMLHTAVHAAGQAHPELAELLRERCAVNLGEKAECYSWIPLICEMATNLSTTLWVKGYRWYTPNRLEEQRIISTGAWEVRKPTEVPGDMPLLDLTLTNQDAPAALITTLAGYLSTCFNLLDFFYASLGSSRPLRAQLVHLLDHGHAADWSEERLKQLADLPFALREAALQELRERHRLAPGDPLSGQLALLEPWLNCRDRYPQG